jgi:hypothetical protein
VSTGPVKVPVKPIADTELLTRYITDQEYLTPNSDRVHWRAFRPRPSDKELSIARIGALTVPEIWQLGDQLAGQPSNRTVCGRADLGPTEVRAVKTNGHSLDAIPDDPPERHAIIVGWPDDSNARKTAMMQLRAISVRYIR